MRITDFTSLVMDKTAPANTSKYKVTLPTISATQFGTIDPRNLNMTCTAVNLPGRQIETTDRIIGMKTERVVNGFVSDDVSMTFMLTNQYEAKRYFDEWSALSVDTEAYELNYKYDEFGNPAYAKPVTIHQLNAEAENVYVCTLQEAFPTTINAIELSGEASALVQLNVQLSYTNWSGEWKPPGTEY